MGGRGRSPLLHIPKPCLPWLLNPQLATFHWKGEQDAQLNATGMPCNASHAKQPVPNPLGSRVDPRLGRHVGSTAWRPPSAMLFHSSRANLLLPCTGLQDWRPLQLLLTNPCPVPAAASLALLLAWLLVLGCQGPFTSHHQGSHAGSPVIAFGLCPSPSWLRWGRTLLAPPSAG